MAADQNAETCVDCQEREASLTIRKRRLCAPCFIRYVNSKVLKRMESYRFKNLAGDQKRRLFLPTSGGVSSLTLLQVLDAQLEKQIVNRNRTAYELVIARVVLPDTRDLATIEAEYQKLAQRFPLHTFLPLVPLHDVLRTDESMHGDLAHIGLHLGSSESNEESMQRVYTAATSPTARADLESVLLRRLLVAIAKRHRCEGVLWGHSDSRLAALALADVAEGRGGSVSSSLADGPSLHGVDFNYPTRDLFKVELQTYAQALTEPLTYETECDSAEEQVTNIRNTSIGKLLGSYIILQGEKYPSIMANVVRTASKLQVQKTGNGVVPCTFCIMPTTRAMHDSGDKPILCYGCKRMKQDIKATNRVEDAH